MAIMENFPPAMIDTGGKLPPASWTSVAALPSVSPLSVLVHIGKDVTFSVVDIGAVVSLQLRKSSRIFAKNSLHDNGIIWGGAKMIYEKKN
jgi:hypothetical protein